MIREQRPPDLDKWIDTATRGLLASFANGLSRDRAGVAAALAEPWSIGQTEGQITRLQFVKRRMFGRAKLDLLEARLMRPEASFCRQTIPHGGNSSSPS